MRNAVPGAQGNGHAAGFATWRATSRARGPLAAKSSPAMGGVRAPGRGVDQQRECPALQYLKRYQGNGTGRLNGKAVSSTSFRGD